MYSKFVKTSLLIITALFSLNSMGEDIGTAFTYQGELTDSGVPANAAYDFEFKLYDAVIAGSQIGSTTEAEDVNVSDGHFSISLDFGANAFTGEARYVEIGVRPGASTGAYTSINSRQRINSSPYSIFSKSAETLSGVRTQVSAQNEISISASSDWVDIPDMSVTVTTGNHPVLILFNSGNFLYANTNDVNVYFRISIDNSPKAFIEKMGDLGDIDNVYLFFLETLNAGTHTIKIQWRKPNSMGLIRMNYAGIESGIRNLIVIEL